MAKGAKTCPSCNKDCGCRTLVCKCGHDFGINKKVLSKKNIKQTKSQKSSSQGKVPATKKHKRTKFCATCKKEWGLKKRTCTCGWEFPTNKINIKLIEDWTTLIKGDIIKSITGSGPYYLFTNDKDILEIQRMGSYGIFKVVRLEESGILGRAMTKNKYGTEFIYMGEDKLGNTGRHMGAHKLQLIQKARAEI